MIAVDSQPAEAFPWDPWLGHCAPMSVQVRVTEESTSVRSFAGLEWAVRTRSVINYYAKWPRLGAGTGIDAGTVTIPRQ